MEPAINANLTHNVEPPYDVTLPLLRDIGWFADEDVDLVTNDVDQCPGSDLPPTIFIDGTDTGVANPLFTSGCTITDLINNIAATSANHGQFESRLVMLLNALEDSGFITREDRLILQAAGAKANLP